MKIPRVFISYSHDSEGHKEKVYHLAADMIQDNIDVEIDQYHEAPPEGWPRWMDQQIRNADFVIIICTKEYLDRVNNMVPGMGKGAAWESLLITQDIYDKNGMNHNYLPVILSEMDRQYIPNFLKPYTYYKLPSDFQKMCKRVRGETVSSKPKLGEKHNSLQNLKSSDWSEQIKSGQDFALIVADQFNCMLRFYSLESSENIRVEFRGLTFDDLGSLRSLRNLGNKEFNFAYGLTSEKVLFQDFKELTKADGINATLILRRVTRQDNHMSEVSMNGLTADEIAVKKIERILFNKHRPKSNSPIEFINEAMIWSSSGGSFRVKESPFPKFYKEFRDDKTTFFATCRLFSVMFMRDANLVEHIQKMDFRLTENVSLHVTFKGVRAKKYTNSPPFAVDISGDCLLEDQAPS